MDNDAEFDLSVWSKEMGLNEKTFKELNAEDLIDTNSLLAFDVGDIKELEITMGQKALLKKALITLKQSVQYGHTVMQSDPVTTKDLKGIDVPDDLLQLFSMNTNLTSKPDGGKPLGLEGKQPLFIRDFVGCLGLFDSEEQSILQNAGGPSLLLKSSSKPKPEQVTAEQWISANARILKTMVQSGELNASNINGYLTHTEQVGEYLQIYETPGVMLYDHRFRDMVAKGSSVWGQPDIHGIGFFLRPKVKNLEKNQKFKYQRKEGSAKESRERPVCKEWQSENGCKWPQCKFRHVCIIEGCNKNHPQFLHAAASRD